MLKYLHILNFAIIKKLELDFQTGLTVITGETGAGKSIIIDALEIVLGARTDVGIIRQEEDKCEINLCVDISNLTLPQIWLDKNDIEHDNECIIRRIVHRDGRSKLTINGTPCSLQQMRQLATTFIAIHSQNQQQLLMKKYHQRQILDEFGNHQTLCLKIQNIFSKWHETEEKREKFLVNKQQVLAEIELLKYQLAELDQLAVSENEYVQLDEEQKQLANADKIIHTCQQTLTLINESEQLNAIKALHQSQHLLQTISGTHSKIVVASDLIDSATIQISEAVCEITDILNSIEINPSRLEWVEDRINRIHELARKHHILPVELYEFHQKLKSKLDLLMESDTESQLFDKQLTDLAKEYFQYAEQLSTARIATAKKLNKLITQKIQDLGLPGAQFKVDLTMSEPQKPNQYGNEEIEFLISTNPGNPLQPLAKIASGGELSRIALAIYVSIAQTHSCPVLIFDEVDVGIGGSTAASVGQLLKTLSVRSQILCITHLPQVASYGDHHFKVVKKIEQNHTATVLVQLNIEQKVQELARMLGGVTVTAKTLAHAREMLEENLT